MQTTAAQHQASTKHNFEQLGEVMSANNETLLKSAEANAALRHSQTADSFDAVNRSIAKHHKSINSITGNVVALSEQVDANHHALNRKVTAVGATLNDLALNNTTAFGALVTSTTAANEKLDGLTIRTNAVDGKLDTLQHHSEAAAANMSKTLQGHKTDVDALRRQLADHTANNADLGASVQRLGNAVATNCIAIEGRLENMRVELDNKFNGLGNVVASKMSQALGAVPTPRDVPPVSTDITHLLHQMAAKQDVSISQKCRHKGHALTHLSGAAGADGSPNHERLPQHSRHPSFRSSISEQSLSEELC
jgi:chromosome segregation ATPase